MSLINVGSGEKCITFSNIWIFHTVWRCTGLPNARFIEGSAPAKVLVGGAVLLTRQLVNAGR
jgi:hypothetical protein